MSASTPIRSVAVEKETPPSTTTTVQDGQQKKGVEAQAKMKGSSKQNGTLIASFVNEALFRPSEWDDYPLKRDDKHSNKIVQPDFAPFNSTDEPENLPGGFAFIALDAADETTLKTITEFLNENYEGPFKFSADHVKWVLNVPSISFPRIIDIRNAGGCVLGVATSESKKLVGLIAARPITYTVDARVVCSLEVVWMCTIAQLRGKRLASVMMKELYRRAHKWGVDIGMIFCVPRQLPALFTVGPIRILGRQLLPTNPPKPNKNIGLVRFANKRDVTRMMKIYKKYREHWRLHREYNKREFEHTFLSRSDVMTYVIRTDRGDIKDFVSLFELELKSGEKVALVHFVSYLTDKLLELFMQNILFIMFRNKFDAVYIADVNGVGAPLTSTLSFAPVSDCPPTYLYQFNYNTTVIPPNESQLAGAI